MQGQRCHLVQDQADPAHFRGQGPAPTTCRVSLGPPLRDGDRAVKSREARHFYDIARLLMPGSPALANLHTPGLLAEIVQDCHAVTERWFSDGHYSAMPSNLADSPAFTDPAVGERIRGAYDTACRDLCHPGTAVPTWNDVVETVHSQRPLLQA